jgi:glycine/D-amino acid oxidase-like deaminating enzyme
MPQRGLNRLRNFIETEEIDCDFGPRPTLTMHTSRGAANSAQFNLATGEKWIGEHELRERIGSSYYTGAVDMPDYYGIHPAKLVVGHAKAALGVGVELFEHSPALQVKEGKTPVVSTPRGKIRASKVLIATNAYTPRLGFFEHSMYPVHQYSFATRKLSAQEIHGLGLDQWQLRFEPHILPVTFNLTPSGHFFVRMVLGYASFNSSQWRDIEGARQLSQRLFEQRYPQIASIGLSHSWHGVTGHTTLMQQIAGRIGDGNIHISAAYNGLGIMPAHNNGYLTACEMTGHVEKDTRFLTGTSGHIPMPGDYYRSLMLKPFMSLMTPV